MKGHCTVAVRKTTSVLRETLPPWPVLVSVCVCMYVHVHLCVNSSPLWDDSSYKESEALSYEKATDVIFQTRSDPVLCKRIILINP